MTPFSFTFIQMHIQILLLNNKALLRSEHIFAVLLHYSFVLYKPLRLVQVCLNWTIVRPPHSVRQVKTQKEPIRDAVRKQCHPESNSPNCRKWTIYDVSSCRQKKQAEGQSCSSAQMSSGYLDRWTKRENNHLRQYTKLDIYTII